MKPAKILVVDDEPQFERLILQLFRKDVRKGTYEFTFALNGLEALEKLDQNLEFDMVLTDINMPQMDGLSLLEKISQKHTTLRVVIISAYNDMPNIRKAMNLGAFDFITKPIAFPDLEKTIQKTLEEAALVRQAQKAKELDEKNQQLEELDRIKSRFFTNISHEFRTPLTVIDGMAEQVAEQPEQWLHKGVGMIRRNANQLLELVNQILDLSKLESGKLQAQYVQADLIPYLRNLIEPFQYLAEVNDIELKMALQPDELVMDIDPDKMMRILTNLLSNAIKFTPEGGHILVQLQQQESQVEISVKNTGSGIPKEDRSQIFDRFYQVEGSFGTGIGLSLVKQLVELFGGSIQVDSELDNYTTFTVNLPIRQEAIQQLAPLSGNDIISYPVNQSAPIVANDTAYELPQLLIVEDNPDVAHYLISILEGHFQLSLARNGQEGIEQALEKVPDIIVSDVMMPQKDGFELCESLKNDARTSHIPIVLLTAKAGMTSRIAGLRQGADAYLAKPFNKQELLTTLENLLQNREKLRQRYQSGESPQTSEQENQIEDEFIQLIRATIHAHLDDPDFGITELCREVAMSRTQLHRKTKALTGRSTSSFVRLIRLNKAKELLHQTDLNISQIAFEVGFRDPKYFSRTFAEEFGQSPNQIR